VSHGESACSAASCPNIDAVEMKDTNTSIGILK
jgi:hypothetical protein